MARKWFNRSPQLGGRCIQTGEAIFNIARVFRGLDEVSGIYIFGYIHVDYSADGDKVGTPAQTMCSILIQIGSRAPARPRPPAGAQCRRATEHAGRSL